MKYCATTVFMPDLPLLEQIKALQKYGYDGIELRVRRVSDELRAKGEPGFWGYHVNDITPENFSSKAAEINQLLSDHGLKMAGIAAAVDCTDLEQFKPLLEGAVETKAPFIRVGSPSGFNADSNYFALLGQMIEGYAKCLELSHGSGVKLVVETHGYTLYPSASTAYSIVRNFSPQDVGVNYDPQNMVKDGYETTELALQLLGPYLAHCHVGGHRPYADGVDANGTTIWKWDRCSLEEGLYDYLRLLKALKQVHYQGYISLEDFRMNISVEQKLKAGIDYLRKLEALI